MEGILTLQRKDEQRLSKTKLLLQLRDDMIALRTEVTTLKQQLAEERELTQKMAGWVQSTLKPSLVQLRQESNDSVNALRSEVNEAAEKSRHSLESALKQEASIRAEQIKEAEARDLKLKERLEQQAAQAAEALAVVEKRIRVDLTQGLQHVNEAVSSSEQRASQLSNQLFSRAGESTAAGLKQLRGECSTWHQQQQEALEASKRQLYAEMEKVRVESAVQETKERNALDAALRSHVEHLLNKEREERGKWEQQKEVWFASFLKDAQSNAERAREDWKRHREETFTNIHQALQKAGAQLNEALDTTAKQLNVVLSSHSKSFSDDLAETRRVEVAARSELSHKIESSLERVAAWQQRSQEAQNEWRTSVWAAVSSWQDRYGPLIVTLAEAERLREQKKAAKPATIEVSRHPVPEWMSAALKEVHLEQYGPLLASLGFDSPQVFMGITSEDVQNVEGMPAGHRKQLVLHVEKMREEQRKQQEDDEYERKKKEALKQIEDAAQERLKGLTELAQQAAQEVTRLEEQRKKLEQEDRDRAAQIAVEMKAIREEINAGKSAVEQLKEVTEAKRAEEAQIAEVKFRALHLENVVALDKKEEVKKEEHVASPPKNVEKKPEETPVVAVVAAEKKPVEAIAPVSPEKAPIASTPPKVATAKKAAKKGAASPVGKMGPAKQPIKKPQGPKRGNGGGNGRDVPPAPGAVKVMVSKEEEEVHTRVEEIAVAPVVVQEKSPTSQVVECIEAHGEREPNGTRMRIRMNTVLEKSGLAKDTCMQLIESLKQDGVVAFKSTLTENSVLTYTPK